MNKIFLILILNFQFLILNSFAQAPNWLWAKRIGGPSTNSNDAGFSIATDASGNVYTAGVFGGTVDFNPGAGVFNLASVGGYDDVFIFKLDSSGNFVWAKSFGNANLDEVYSIAVDASKNIYIIGDFNGTVDFDPGAGVFNLTSSGGYYTFISKLDSAGNFIWAKAFGNTLYSTGNSLVIDSFANVYSTGSFKGTVDFDPGVGTFNITSAGYSDIFVSKLDSAGNFIWAKAMGGIMEDYGYDLAINPSASADIYITGSFRGTCDFDPGAGVFNLTAVGIYESFYVCKLDSSGNFSWAKSFGSMANNYAFTIAADPSGNGDVYTKGSFVGTVDFDPGVGVYNLTGGGGYISKLDSAGNFIWAIALGGGAGIGHSLAFDVAGNIYASGYFTGTKDFDPGPATFNLTSAGLGDVYISKYDSAGNFAWAKKAGGIYTDVSTAITLDNFGNAFITGQFQSPSIVFGSTTLTNAGTIGTYGDVFITKVGASITTGNNEIENIDNRVLIYPNPASDNLTITLVGNTKKVEVTITDITGKMIYSTVATETQKIEISTKDFAEGIYLVQIQKGEFLKTGKLIVTK